MKEVELFEKLEQLTDADISINLFMAQMAGDETLVTQIENMMEAVNIARDNNLRVSLFRDEKGKVTYQVEKKHIGFI